jgi:GT2 family glycosyltransferase
VILSWNGREDTLGCLKSLAEVRWDRLTPIVVDNGSTDGTAEAVRQAYPDAVVLRSERNTGATGGNNFGMRHALELEADYVLLLNNDTVLDSGMVEALVAEAERRPEAGAVCPLIYYVDPPDLIWYAGANFDPRKGYYGRMTGYRERDNGQYATVREVGAMSTTAVLVPRRVLEEVGLLDDSLFIHIEDLEWSLRIRRAGHRIYCVPSARMWHKISAGSGGEDSPMIAYYAMRNTLAVGTRHAPLRGLPALRRYALTVAAHVAHARKGEHPLRNLRAVLEGVGDFHRGRLGARRAAHR